MKLSKTRAEVLLNFSGYLVLVSFLSEGYTSLSFILLWVIAMTTGHAIIHRVFNG